ncbi:hypothetical protein BH11ARM2_BH11ARM2_01630 [soil metagenome]
MNPGRGVWASLPLLFLLIGCGGPKAYQPKPVAKVAETTLVAATPEDLIPLREGDQWVYDVENGTNVGKGDVPERSELTIEVERVESKGDGRVATLRVLRDGHEVDTWHWLVNAKGLFQTTGTVRGATVAYSPPQPMILFPVKEDATYGWNGKGVCPDGNPGTMKSMYKVLGVMDADTGMGKKSGIAIESTQDFTSTANKGGMASTTWYAPKIGILRIVQTTVVAKGAAIKSTLRLTKAPL